MRSLVEEMKEIWGKFSEEQVRVICFPLPPVPTKNDRLIYMPDAYMSRVTDKGARYTVSGVSETDVLGVVMSENGPAVVLDVPLERLVSLRLNSRDGLPYLDMDSFAICAGVSYYHYVKSDEGQYVDKISLDSLSFRGSCNAASHYVVPQAPFLSALGQYRTSPKTDETGGNIDYEIQYMNERAINYVSPTEAEFLFPWIKWGRNSIIDDFVSKCLVDPSVSYYKALTGIGGWSQTYLKGFALNHLKTKERICEDFCVNGGLTR